MKKLAILGSTGSIGTQSLDIIDKNPGCFQVGVLSCGRRVGMLTEQIEKYRPAIAVTELEEDARNLAADLKSRGIHGTEVLWGQEGLKTAASSGECDMVLNSLLGISGLAPTMAAIEAGKDIALANKETLVAGGSIVMDAAAEKGVKLLPVDSEHSAVFQCLQGGGKQIVEKLLLTASGGPFFGKKRAELGSITVEQALKHPNWAMGRKITIDSSTLVNKGLEVMEAGWLFSLSPERIEVVVQPKSIIHSMIQFTDGAVLAQLGTPDMKLPIQYAMTYPDRVCLSGKRLDFFELQKIEFYKPDTDTFRALSLAYDAFKEGGSLPTVYNAANEMAVALFLDRKIGYLQITELIERAIQAHQKIANPTLDEVLFTEQETYDYIRENVRG